MHVIVHTSLAVTSRVLGVHTAVTPPPPSAVHPRPMPSSPPLTSPLTVRHRSHPSRLSPASSFSSPFPQPPPKLMPTSSSLLARLARSLGHGPRAIQDARNELRWMKQALESPPKGIHPSATSLQEMVDRRVRHEPLQYILGSVPFGPLHIVCRPPVLIPRMETEDWRPTSPTSSVPRRPSPARSASSTSAPARAASPCFSATSSRRAPCTPPASTSRTTRSRSPLRTLA
ncbi:hypothetical protein BN946_scf184656.g10 [Trametes cinnabarina]|uniref:Release factor glutamine methyltransferase N-terminal domain-containing protein n=1 Tax=Pycnoporus cinnabarinus TaxID=5643 RepID=A0A060S8B0_PYCCI|nr:hypothetical protein BN946_scf184656.g10 [Trametes cinnabarina]